MDCTVRPAGSFNPEILSLEPPEAWCPGVRVHDPGGRGGGGGGGGQGAPPGPHDGGARGGGGEHLVEHPPYTPFQRSTFKPLEQNWKSADKYTGDDQIEANSSS